MNATRLRADLYAVLDQILETGESVTIERKGRRLRIVVDEVPVQTKAKPRWPAPRPEWVNGSVEDLVSISWAGAWRS